MSHSYEITLHCEKGHGQVFTLSGIERGGLHSAELYAQLLTASPDLFKTPPTSDSPLGKCHYDNCGARLVSYDISPSAFTRLLSSRGLPGE